MASPDDDLSYLQPTFDPASTTVAGLRKILFTHDIKYPSAAKKADLVAIFNSELKPQAAKILSKYRKIQRSSRGIEDAASSIASTQDEDEPVAQAASSTKARRGRPKKSVAAAAEEDGEETLIAPQTTMRKKTPATTKSRAADEKPERSQSRPRQARRKSTATPAPALKQDNSVPDTWKTYGDDSPFSAENPFQSGSSPPPVSTTSKRRQTDGPQSTKPRKSEGRRKTDGPKTVRSAVVEMPIGRTYDQPDYDDDGIDAGEEFAPEEQKALEKARREGNAAVVPVRRRQPTSSPALGNFLLTFGLVVSASLGALWGQEKFNVGYCGVGRDSEKIGGVQIPDWADALRPRCEPCPPHAACYDQLKTTCDRDFVLRHHPLSLNGVVPLPPTCEPDSEKLKKIKAVSDFVTDELRKKKADAECGNADTPQVTEDELKQKVEARVRKGLTQEEVDALFAQAIDDVAGRDEVVTYVDDAATVRSFSSKSLARIGIACAIRRSFRRTLERYIKQLVTLVVLLGAITYPYYKYKDNVATQREAKKYAAAVYSSLQDDAAALAYDAMNTRDGYLSVNQLRDDVLRNEFSSSRRKALWRHVEKLVEQNSNVRAKVGALDTGDVGRGWKWIGAIRSLEDSAERPSTGSRRGSSRYSMPQLVSSSPPMSEVSATNGNVRPKEEFQRWNSGSRPAF